MIDLEKCQDGDFKICAELGKAYYYGNKATQITKNLVMMERCSDVLA